MIPTRLPPHLHKPFFLCNAYFIVRSAHARQPPFLVGSHGTLKPPVEPALSGKDSKYFPSEANAVFQSFLHWPLFPSITYYSLALFILSAGHLYHGYI